jgi:hypothetical protein
MQALLSTYQLPFAPFQDLLVTNNALVAGSAALSCYLEQEESPIQFDPNDIDIWVDDTQWKTLHPIIVFLNQHGYTKTVQFDSTPDEYGAFIHHIRTIHTFTRENKKIQLIFVDVWDLDDYIQKYFDLSICMTWWNAKEDQFETLYPSDTQYGIMYVFNQHEHTDKERHEIRLAKYESRGFRQQRMFPTYQVAMDPLEDLTGLHGVQAFDTIQYEEVSAQEHIKETRWNCLLKVGDQFQAYDRYTLYDYLVEHSTMVRGLGKVYDTPHKQSIMYGEALEHLINSDFTIYELVPEYTYQGKSLHTFRAYTVKGWKLGAYGYLCMARPLEDEEQPGEMEDQPVVMPYIAWPTDTSISTQDVQEWDSLYADYLHNHQNYE